MRAPVLFFALAAIACGSSTPKVDAPPPPVANATIAPSPPPPPPEPTWVERSNAFAKVLIDVNAKYLPENASAIGVDGYDDRIVDFTPGHEARLRDDLAKAKTELESHVAAEKDARVAQDLQILIAAADRSIRGSKIHEEHEVEFVNVAELVFGSLRGLLDDRIDPKRRAASAKRLARYAGLDGGRPITDLAREQTIQGLSDKKLMPPAKIEVEKALQNGEVLTDGIDKLFQKYAIAGYEEPLGAYKKVLADYQKWIKSDVLPRSRSDFRLAPEVYAMRLEQVGVDAKPDDLAALGHRGFSEIVAQMKKIAPDVARARKLPSSDYREVIRALKKEQVVGADILPLYEKTLADVEAIIVKEHLVTLPKRAAKIRLATAAESAASPAPHLDPPRLIGNTGEPAVFVLPLSVPPAPGSKEKESKLDDFTHAAAAWTLTAHEARPGHELQFASMIEAGVSIARAVFSFNSANVEGWGLYAEYITWPFMPPEGQLVSLQLRLQRAARVFLDPELEMGKITPAAARELLVKEVGLSPAFANSEVERYTFKMPGQATSYYYGFTKLLEIRREIEQKLGASFSLLKFDDFVISKGLLPPNLLRDAARKELL